MTKFQRKYEELRRTAKKLADRLDQIGESEEYKAVFTSAMIHGTPYRGLNYVKELKAVKQLLDE